MNVGVVDEVVPFDADFGEGGLDFAVKLGVPSASAADFFDEFGELAVGVGIFNGAFVEFGSEVLEFVDEAVEDVAIAS